jgi:hypothetical protein
LRHVKVSPQAPRDDPPAAAVSSPHRDHNRCSIPSDAGHRRTVKSNHRRLSALLLLFTLLFSQWAVATYACAMPAMSVAAAASDAMAGMDCEGEAPDRSMLCVKHCADDQAASQTQPAPVDPCAPAPSMILPVVHDRPLPDHRIPRSSSPPPRQTAPPLVLTARLRI